MFHKGGFTSKPGLRPDESAAILTPAKRGVRVTFLIGRRSEEEMRRSSERTGRFMVRLLHGAILAAFVMLFLVCGVLFGGGR